MERDGRENRDGEREREKTERDEKGNKDGEINREDGKRWKRGTEREENEDQKQEG